jgi:hypothetical protein
MEEMGIENFKVVGIEPNKHVIETARKALEKEGIDKAKFELIEVNITTSSAVQKADLAVMAGITWTGSYHDFDRAGKTSKGEKLFNLAFTNTVNSLAEGGVLFTTSLPSYSEAARYQIQSGLKRLKRRGFRNILPKSDFNLREFRERMVDMLDFEAYGLVPAIKNRDVFEVRGPQYYDIFVALRKKKNTGK